MAGILDSKTRVFDTVLTTEGRRQIANQDFDISFASFTDSGVFYESDIVSGSTDPTSRIYFEAPTSLRKDQITIITDDNGLMLPFFGAGDDLFLSNNNVFASGSSLRLQQDNFSEAIGKLLNASIDNYIDLRLIGSKNEILEEDGFALSTNNINFTVTDRMPFDITRDLTEIVVEESPGMFHDARLTHIQNFKYMPPVCKSETKSIGIFPCHGQEPYSYKQLISDISKREKHTVTFPDSSRDNNIFSQMFEVSGKSMTKLDVIDYGEVIIDNDSDNTVKRIFFVGKIVVDGNNSPTFLNQFTLIYD
jgi:hypothetical protein